jgi:outer membrane biosynthesis protein TonB
MAVAALFAARKWTFEAASLGGKKVRSEVVLHFRFEPTERASR